MIAVVGMAFEARIAARLGVPVVCGGDGTHLEQSLARAMAAGCKGLISFGVAGGLAPGLTPGTCIIGSSVIDDGKECPTDARWAQRLNIGQDAARSEVSRRMAAQWPDEEKVRSADFVIDNSGSLDETERRVRAVYSKLSEEAVKRPTRTGPVLAPGENEKTEN